MFRVDAHQIPHIIHFSIVYLYVTITINQTKRKSVERVFDKTPLIFFIFFYPEKDVAKDDLTFGFIYFLKVLSIREEIALNNHFMVLICNNYLKTVVWSTYISKLR